MSTAARLTLSELRALVRDAIPAESYEYGSQAPLHQFFVPKSHARALHPNVPLVVGSRGTGKTYWWGALQSAAHREQVERLAPDARIRRATIVQPGFGKPLDLAHYPSRDVLADVLAAGHAPRTIWRAVMAWAVGAPPEIVPWPERLAWTAANQERVDRLVQDRDQSLQAADQDLLVVFDSLDWTTNDQDTLYSLVEALLQVALEFRACRRIRAKVFLRADQFDDPRIARFPDAAKLAASKVQLHWLRTELFGLLWQLMAFHPAKGASFRQLVFEKVVEGKKGGRGLQDPASWELPSSVLFDAKVQERLFHEITGPWMGNDARRGFPYRWLPQHLADALDEVSPRSFLVAMRTAAVCTIEEHADHGSAIHPLGLWAGVQQASEYRKEEISEHRWVPKVMKALKDRRVLVPVPFEIVEATWAEAGTLAEIARVAAEVGEPWLLPEHLERGAAGVRDDLVQLGVFRVMRDGRIDIPDVYRLGFGIGRKGGIPVSSGAGGVR